MKTYTYTISIPAFWDPSYDAGAKETADLLRAAHAVAMDAWLEFRKTPAGDDWHPWLDKENTLSQLTFELGKVVEAMDFLAKYDCDDKDEMEELPEGRALRRTVFGEFMGRRNRSLCEKPGRVEVTL